MFYHHTWYKVLTFLSWPLATSLCSRTSRDCVFTEHRIHCLFWSYSTLEGFPASGLWTRLVVSFSPRLGCKYNHISSIFPICTQVSSFRNIHCLPLEIFTPLLTLHLSTNCPRTPGFTQPKGRRVWNSDFFFLLGPSTSCATCFVFYPKDSLSLPARETVLIKLLKNKQTKITSFSYSFSQSKV